MFNHGGISPSPRAVLEAQARFAAEANVGPSYVVFRLHDRQIERVRERLARLFGCDPEELAVTGNATFGLHAGILGCPAGTGDAFLTTAHDYPRTFSAFRQRERRDGVRFVPAAAPAAPASAAALMAPLRAAWPQRCALAVVSHVTFLTGNIYPVREVADLALERGARLLVDGAHSFGLLPFSRDDIQCDMYTTCLHKWVNGPLGTGFFYVRRSRIRETWPLHPADEGLDRDIRKFEQVGTRSAAPYLAIMEALDLHEAIGPARKLARITWLRGRLIGRLEGRSKITVLASPVPGLQTALLAVEIEGVRAPALTSWLFTKRGLYATTATRDGMNAVRISPNIFTTAAEVDRLGDALIEAAASGID
jgi:selenocysteine lyase/cysteine desulfurase